MPVCKRSFIPMIIATVIDKYVHEAYFDGVNNYLKFSQFEVIPQSKPGFVSFEGVFEKSDMWITTILSATTGADSKRILFFEKKLYIGYIVASNFTDDGWEKISDGKYHRIKVYRDEGNYWHVELDGVVVTTTSAKANMSIVADAFGSQYSGNTSVQFMNGVVSNINLNNKRQYKLDETWSLYPFATESLSENGDEEFVLPQSTSVLSVTPIANGFEIECIADKSNYPSVEIPIVSGKSYEVHADIETISGSFRGFISIASVGDTAQRINGSATIGNAVNKKTIIFNSDSHAKFYIDGVCSIGDKVRYTNISIQQTLKGLYMNFQREDVRRRLI